MLDRDSTGLRVIVMWEHVTPSDRKITLPSTSALFRIHDARAVQFWDDERAISRLMVAELPADTLKSVAEMDSVSTVAWDCVALYRAGRKWGERFPVPDWSGRPIADAIETMRERLGEIERAAAADSAR
ncbi:MAG: hypothetical protein HYR74_01430 [Candidatus Eisenbacteria bacterium]|nr:hypothetical protein [Candidatus Eisenbacteria bacterium]